jgi:hypothetical protein
MKLYKLTEQDYTTYHGSMEWGKGITNKVKPCENPSMCSSDVIHAYTDLNLALLLNPIHAYINNPRIFEASGKIVISDWDKCGVFKLTTKKEIDAPEWYKSDKKNDVIIIFAILCAESVLYLFENKYPENKKPSEAIKAAKEYLKNKNSYAAYAVNAAYAAYAAAYADNAANAAYAANAAAYAAYEAAYDAAYAAYAAYEAARAANAAYEAAYKAAYADNATYAANLAYDAANAAYEVAYDAAARAANATYEAARAARADGINFAELAKQAIKITIEEK